jgi:transcriptional regulator with XRE-family HTH domain
MTLLKDYIGDVLKEERTNQNRSLRDVASSSFTSLGYLSEVERGRKEVSSLILENICRALFISMPDLLVNVVVKMNQDIEKDLIATHKDLMSVK